MTPEVPTLIRNPGFEKGVGAQKFLGWDYEEHAGKWPGRAFDVTSEASAGPRNSPTLKVTRIHEEVYSLVHQKIRVHQEDSGKKIRFSAMLKTDKVGPEGWKLTVNMLGSGGSILAQSLLKPLIGTTEWSNSFVTAVIPAGTTDVDIGFLLMDSGTGWASQPTFVIE